MPKTTHYLKLLYYAFIPIVLCNIIFVALSYEGIREYCEPHIEKWRNSALIDDDEDNVRYILTRIKNGKLTTIVDSDIIDSREDISHFVLFNDSLICWTSNTVSFLNEFLESSSDKYDDFKFNDYEYLLKRHIHGEYTIISLIRQKDVCNAICSSTYSKILWYVGYILFYLIFISIFTNYKKGHTLKTFCSIALIFLIIHWLSFYVFLPQSVATSYLFSKELFFSKFALTTFSLGQSALSTTFTYVIIFVFVYNVNISAIRQKNIPIFIFAYQLFAAMIFVNVLTFINYAVKTPSINISSFNFQSNTIYIILVYFIIGIKLLVFMMFKENTLKLISSHLSFRKLFINNIIVSVLIFAFYLYTDDIIYIVASGGYLVINTLIDVFMRGNIERGMRPFQYILIVSICAIFISINIEWLKNKAQYEKKMAMKDIYITKDNKFSYNTFVEHILESEYDQIANDSTIKCILANNDTCCNTILNYINDNYFKNLTNKFTVRVYTDDSRRVYHKNFKRLIENKTLSYKVGNSGYYFSNEWGKYSYYTLIPYVGECNLLDTNYCFIQIEEFIDNKTKAETSLAIYSRDTLKFNIGSYKYLYSYKNTRNKNITSKLTYTDNMEHSIIPLENQHFLILSIMNNTTFMSIMANLFLLSIILSALLSLIFIVKNTTKLRMEEGRSIHSALRHNIVYSSIIISSVVAFSILLYLLYNRNIERVEKISEKTSSIDKHVYNIASDHPNISVQELLNILYLQYDISASVYDFNGKLLATTFNNENPNFVLSNIINPNFYFLRNRNLTVEKEHIEGNEFLSAYTFFDRNNEDIGYIAVSESHWDISTKDWIVNSILKYLLISLILITIFNFIIYVSVNKAFKPIRYIYDNICSKDRLEDSSRIEYSGKNANELKILIDKFNELIDKIKQNAEQVQEMKLEKTWRDTAKKIAHEIKNPLTPMKLYSQQIYILQKKYEDNNLNQQTLSLLEQINYLTKVTEEFTTFSKISNSNFIVVNLNKTIFDIISLFDYSDVKFFFSSVEENALIYADISQINRVFTNLFKNAIEAIPSGWDGKIEVILDVEDENYVVYIKDNGFGIKEENIDKIFEHNYSTKKSGMGLGLAIAKNILTISNASISVESKENIGSVFTLKFPRYIDKGENH